MGRPGRARWRRLWPRLGWIGWHDLRRGDGCFALSAINPGGGERWRYVDSNILFEPQARPQNELLFMGGRHIIPAFQTVLRAAPAAPAPPMESRAIWLDARLARRALGSTRAWFAGRRWSRPDASDCITAPTAKSLRPPVVSWVARALHCRCQCLAATRCAPGLFQRPGLRSLCGRPGHARLGSPDAGGGYGACGAGGHNPQLSAAQLSRRVRAA